MTAPTEAEIRELLEVRIARYPHDSADVKLRDAVGDFFDLIDYQLHEEPDGLDEYGNDVWTDLRKSEAATLQALVQAATADAIYLARKAIVEQVVGVAMQFAAGYPDAPRAKPEISAAV